MKVNRLFNMGMVIMMLVTSFAVSQPVAAAAPAKFTPRIVAGADTVPGEVVVAFADSQGKNLVEKIEQAVQTANDTGGEVTRLSMDGSAVIQVEGDTSAALSELNAQSDVLYAEPNYVFSVPTTQSTDLGSSPSSDYVIRDVAPSPNTDGKSVMAVPRSAIQSMVAMGTYPSDTYLSNNQGWSVIGADIVWPNPTPSAGICEVDTGVDYVHPDLTYTYTYSYTYYIKVRRKWVAQTGYATATGYRVIPGYDFVNADSDPMDDNGHGTHVAGIMVATQNNNAGISGVSTGNVVATKALDAQGVGTNFDIAKAIQYCADRTDVRVINLSLGGPAQSTSIHDALLYATTPTTSLVLGGAYNGMPGKGKLVVVAAGNTNSSNPTFPAGYSNHLNFPEFPTNSILSVASSGKMLVLGNDLDYSCKADTSNKNGIGAANQWINVFAPGEDIYSTTPWDKPFYDNYYGAINTRYDYMSGTSMAAAFVSAAAARRMGYKPFDTNDQVGAAVISTGDVMTSSCTINEMQAVPRVNVARLMDRAGIHVSVFDAASGLALNGATVLVSYTDSFIPTGKTGTLAPQTYLDTTGNELDPTRIFTYYKPFTDILDVPTKGADGATITNYSLLVNQPGYTNGYQPAFQQEAITTLASGTFNAFTNGAVPPISSSFNVVLGWHKWRQVLTPGNPPTLYKEALNANDLDLYVWLPQAPGPDVNQPASFIVGYNGDAFNQMEGDSYGTLNGFPFARLKREGGYTDGTTIESTTILYRDAHGAVPANSALPYYAGTYTIMATDYGQTIDHDNDGCGNNFGPNYSALYTGTGPECTGKTPGIPLLGAYFTPYAYVWKDGVAMYFADGSNNHGPWAANTTCNKHWWKAFTMTSATVDVAPAFSTTFAPNAAACDNGISANYIPYTGYTNGNPNDRISITSLDK